MLIGFVGGFSGKWKVVYISRNPIQTANKGLLKHCNKNTPLFAS